MPTVKSRNNGRIARLLVAGALTGSTMLIYAAHSSTEDSMTQQSNGFAALPSIQATKLPAYGECPAAMPDPA